MIVSTGVASSRMMLVAYSPQTNSGIRNQVMPGARIVCVVTTKLSAVAIDENPTSVTPTRASTTQPLE